MSKDLITLEEYKEAEGITNPKEDIRLLHIIPSVSQLVKTYCGNSIVDHYSVDKEETISINWATDIVQLTESPLIEVSTVQERRSPSDPYIPLVQGTDYYVDTSTDSLIKISSSTYGSTWFKGPGAVKVAYTAGYENTPADLKLAVIDLITYYLKDEHKERRTLAGASIQNQSSTTQRDNVAFPDHIKRVLDLYKNF